MRKVAVVVCTITVLSLFAPHAGAATVGTELAPSGAVPGFGSSIAVASDAVIVGAPDDPAKGTRAGSAHIFDRTSTGFSHRATLVPSDLLPGDAFGQSVSISGDHAIAGAPGVDGRGLSSGAAFVFARVDGRWTQTARLTARDAAETDLFGFAVAIAGDTAIVGAPFDDDQGANSGSAYVFVRSGSDWVQHAKLTPTTAVDGFGVSVAVSGTTAVIGAGSESAFVFVRSGSGWMQQAKLGAADSAPYDLFGYHVAVSGDTALIGAPLDDDRGRDSGSAYVFTRGENGWFPHAKLTAADGVASDRYGWSVALSGTTAVVGAPWQRDGGAAYVHKRSGTSWAQIDKLGGTADTGGRFGTSVAVGSGAAIAGAPGAARSWWYPVATLDVSGAPRGGLVQDHAGHLGTLGRTYELGFDVSNDGASASSVTMQLVESGASGRGDASWGTRTITKQIEPGGVASFSFSGSHTWDWIEPTDTIRGSVADHLAARTGCGDLQGALADHAAALTDVTSHRALAERTKASFSFADPIHSYTYRSGAQTSAGVRFDPITVTVVPSAIKLESLHHALGLSLAAKGWACAAWLAGASDPGLHEPMLATSAAYTVAADRLYRIAWDPVPNFWQVPQPEEMEIQHLSDVVGSTEEYVERLLKVASLQHARLEALSRYEGAVRAQQYKPAVIQLDAALRWTEEIGDQLVSIEGISESFTDDVPATMTRQQHLSFASSVREQGLPGQLDGYLRDLGYSNADIGEMQRAWGVAPATPRDGALRASLSSVFDLQQAAEASLHEQLSDAMTRAYGALGMADARLDPSRAPGAGAWFRSSPTVEVLAGGGATAEYKLSGGSWKTAKGAFRVDGQGVIEILMRTKATVSQWPPRASRVRVDWTAPVTTAIAPGAWSRTPVLVDLVIADAGSGPGSTSWSVQRSTGGPATAVGAGRWIPVADEGQWRVNFASRDVAGNQEAYRSVTVRVDLTAPRSDIVKPVGATFVREVDLRGSASDATSGIGTVALVFQPLNTFSGKPSGTAFTRTASFSGGSWTYRGAVETGRYQVWPRATDVAGNIEANASQDAIEVTVV